MTIEIKLILAGKQRTMELTFG